MTNEELNTALYKKMFDEQESFKAQLRDASSQEIMYNAYELVIREDILLSMEENDLTFEQAKALLKSDHPLGDLFLKWESRESGHMAEIRDLIESHADGLIRNAKSNRDAR